MTVERDARGRLLVVDPSLPRDTAGGDVRLTLDAALQAAAEGALADLVEKTGARGGTVVTLDPHTGDILSLAEYPPTDPNFFRTSDFGSTRSRAFLDALEPGSTMKVFLVAGALDEGVIAAGRALRHGTRLDPGSRQDHPRPPPLRRDRRARGAAGVEQRRRRDDRPAARAATALRDPEPLRLRKQHRQRLPPGVLRPPAQLPQLEARRSRHGVVRPGHQRDADPAGGGDRRAGQRRRLAEAAAGGRATPLGRRRLGGDTPGGGPPRRPPRDGPADRPHDGVGGQRLRDRPARRPGRASGSPARPEPRRSSTPRPDAIRGRRTWPGSSASFRPTIPRSPSP